MRSWKPSALVAAAIAAMIAGCQAKAPEPEASTSAPAAAPADTHATDQSLSLVIARHATELMGIPGVVGVYEGATEGRPVLRVMVVARADSTMKRIPKSIEGYDVEVEVGGPIKPMGH